MRSIDEPDFIKGSFLKIHFIFLTSILSTIVLSSFSSSFAQFQNIMVGSSTNWGGPQEPSIIMDRSNTDHLLIGANMNNYYYSTNGGLIWQHGTTNSPYGNVGDPCVLVDSSGSYYFFHLVNDLSRVVCQKAAKMGINIVWSDGSFTGVNGTKDDDKEWAALDWKTNNLYVAWSQFDKHGSTNPADSSEIQFSRSTDKGLSWSPVIRISKRNGNARGGNYSCHCPMPAVGPGNDVYITWMGPEGLMFDISNDAGETWLTDDIKAYPYHIDWLTFNVPGVQRTPGFPVINCDLSPGPNYGNIYICWADEFSGSNDTDVWMVKSADGGNTWSSRIRVNDDPPGRHQFFPWMTIDQTTGYLYFVFYDRRNYSDSNTDVYIAVSKDGGNTFVNTKISESPFIPLQGFFIGDYIGISAHNNIVRPVWTRLDNGTLSLWTAIMNLTSVTDDKIKIITPEDFDILSAYPNPFNLTTNIKYRLKKDGKVVFRIFNILGNEALRFPEQNMLTGDHSITWNAKDFPSGTYIIEMQFGKERKTQKVVLLK